MKKVLIASLLMVSSIFAVACDEDGDGYNNVVKGFCGAVDQQHLYNNMSYEACLDASSNYLSEDEIAIYDSACNDKEKVNSINTVFGGTPVKLGNNCTYSLLSLIYEVPECSLQSKKYIDSAMKGIKDEDLMGEWNSCVIGGEVPNYKYVNVYCDITAGDAKADYDNCVSTIKSKISLDNMKMIDSGCNNEVKRNNLVTALEAEKVTSAFACYIFAITAFDTSANCSEQSKALFEAAFDGDPNAMSKQVEYAMCVNAQ